MAVVIGILILQEERGCVILRLADASGLHGGNWVLGVRAVR